MDGMGYISVYPQEVRRYRKTSRPVGSSRFPAAVGVRETWEPIRWVDGGRAPIPVGVPNGFAWIFTTPKKLAWNPKIGGWGRYFFLSKGGIFRFQLLVFVHLKIWKYEKLESGQLSTQRHGLILLTLIRISREGKLLRNSNWHIRQPWPPGASCGTNKI